MRRTLPALAAGLFAVALVGLAIASGQRERSPARAVLATTAANEQISPETGEPVLGPSESVPAARGAVLAEMTRRLGTPRRVAREARRKARELARIEARIRAHQRAAAETARAAAAPAAATTGTSGSWFDPAAHSVDMTAPASPAEQAWLQGGRGGWVESSGFARAPVNAPDAVRRVIQAGNQIARSPYLWGGGHGRWQDSGYDCSGSVSYALAAGGMLSSSLTSGQLTNWGAPGPGRWLTIYANQGHVFMYVAGLRFDTSGRAGDHASRWQLASRPAAGFVARHYPGL